MQATSPTARRTDPRHGKPIHTMWLQHLVITDFKNIAEADMDFCPGVNCLLGSNGMGKSNLLEAVHFLSFTRPVRSVAESSLIRHGCSGLLVKGVYDTGHANSDTVSCGIVAGRGKKLMLNGKEYDRISSHIGRFPIVTVSPDDSDLIRGSAQERRRLMDMVISQTDTSYLPLLMHYNRALTYRNSMLRAGVSDTLLYESIEQAMEDAAVQIYQRRHDWAEEISASFASHYTAIAADGELAAVGYRSSLTDASLRELFDRNRLRDQSLGYTSAGVHRDDLDMTLGENPMRSIGSQGQMKTFTIALRFAVYDYIRAHTGKTPLLLLDDIFDKLDASRVARIMSLVSDHGRFGQILVTDTNRKHLDETVASIGGEYRMWQVEDGTFTPITDTQP